MNNTLKTTAFGAMTALWLTVSACSSNGGANSAQEAFETRHNNPDTTQYLQEWSDTGLIMNDAVAPEDSAVTLDDGACDSKLVETLINRDIYERIVAGDNFSDINKAQTESSATLSERILTYKTERSEKLATFFDCRDQNAELHNLAEGITTNPYDPANPDKFRALLVNMATERMDDVHALYPLEDLQEAAQEWKDFVVNANHEMLGKLDGVFVDDVLSKRIDDLVENHYDGLALSVARLEMADFLNVEGDLEGTSAQTFAREFQALVTQEIAKYATELLKEKAARGPVFEI
tara:strand:- start:37087 stop:37962 length:876 start_codon:yes stop_codon:yes gene_type:complete